MKRHHIIKHQLKKNGQQEDKLQRKYHFRSINNKTVGRLKPTNIQSSPLSPEATQNIRTSKNYRQSVKKNGKQRGQRIKVRRPQG